MENPKGSPYNLFYKIIMLSVYGRFALNPISEQYKYFKKESDFITAITNDSYVSHNIFHTKSKEKVFLVRNDASRATSLSSKKGSPFISPAKAKY